MLVGILSLLIVGAGTFGAFAYTQADNIVKSVVSSGSVADLLTPEALNGESTGVANILIAGNSADDAGHSGAELTDSIMVVSYNLSTRQLTLISIPRDLWVDVNGTYMKINTAYTNGGMDELKSIVEQVTGLIINQQVLVNYTAFKNMIDAVDGIDITIEADDSRGIYDPMVGFSIANGVQHLDGTQALLLARSRNDPTCDGRVAYGLSNGDFDRQANQRKIIQALLTTIENSSTLANTTELQALISSLSGNVTTDLTAGQLRRLYDLSKQISSTQSITIRGTDSNILLSDYTSWSSGSALIPAAGIGNYTDIQRYITTTLGISTSTTTTTDTTTSSAN